MKILGLFKVDLSFINMKNLVKFLWLTSSIKTIAAQDRTRTFLTNAQVPGCDSPAGSWIYSCDLSTLKIEEYQSTLDPLLADNLKLCKLNVECPQERLDHPKKLNELMYPSGLVPKEVSNHNGTLTQLDKPVAHTQYNGKSMPGGVTAERPSVYDCNPPEGSYEKTCKTRTKHYTSSDPEINRVAKLCEAEVTCHDGEKMRAEKPLIVYFDIQAQKNTGLRIENCRASLKVGPNDWECNGKSLEQISTIAKNQGKNVVVLGNKKP